MIQVPAEAPTGAPGPKSKPVIGVVHRALRAATRNDHASIDRMLLPFDLKKAEHYRIFLNIHCVALEALRKDWREQDCADFEQMLGRVQADLRALGYAVNEPAPSLCMPMSPFHGLGVAYVIRGSRLGAAILRRGVAIDFPVSYLDFMPALSWAEFLPQLECIAQDPNGTDEAVCASRSTFKIFSTEFGRPNAVCSRSP
jgi:heme oxygenase